jgi:tRNA (adenine37-N6)-methyltransferase
MGTYQTDYIGLIHSPFTTLENMPIQPVGARDVEGEVIVDEKYVEGLKDLDGFSHIYLIYHFHRTSRVELQVVPFTDPQVRGVFATRAPVRPAHLGLSVVELVAVNGRRLRIRGVDVLDGTPLIDIKPYIPQFDQPETASCGWVKASRDDVAKRRSDDRWTK